jgi:hypothetical protein
MPENPGDVRWNLCRTEAGSWVVSSSTDAKFTSTDRKRVENWLIVHGGLRPQELERLFQDAEEKGEGAITVPQREIEEDQ